MVFAPKYRRKAFYGSKRVEIGQILGRLWEWKGVNIIKVEVCRPHTYVSRNTTQNERFRVLGIFEGKEWFVDI